MPFKFHSPGDGRLCCAVLLLALLTVPQMLCLPLTADTEHYDVQAHCALNGGVLYRDVLEPNLPGVVWIHMLVRTVAGWSSEVLRAFDLLVVLAMAVVFTRCLGIPLRRENAVHAGFVMLFLWWCYVSLPEWCHCQRDIWLLLPALGAVVVRQGRRRLSDAPSSTARLRCAAVLEGLLWGIGFWLKPFVALPAVCVCMASARTADSYLRFLRESLGVLVGGLIAGAIGMLWLISTGAWEPFWDVALRWNPEYFASRQNRWTAERVAGLYQWLFPWWWAHLIALPVALNQVVRLYSRGRFATTPESHHRAVLAAFYLGWMIQVMCLQHPLLYIHASGVLLALGIAVDAAYRRSVDQPTAWPLLAATVSLLVVTTPATSFSRLSWWGACLREGPTTAAQDALQQSPIVNRTQLEPVLSFLRESDIEDGELTVYSGYLVGIYRALDLQPSTRFALLDVEARVFPSRVSEMTSALSRSRQRFVVSNLIESGFPPEQIDPETTHTEPQLPTAFPASRLAEFPYNQRLVFRSGPYLIHEVHSPVGTLTTDYLPLAD